MIDSLRRAAVFVACLIMCNGFAAAGIPIHGIDWKNGAIVFLNRSNIPVDVEIFWHSTVLHGKTRVAPHGAYVFNNCCYAAGSWYTIAVTMSGHDVNKYQHLVKLALCSEEASILRNFSFGSASVSFNLGPATNGRSSSGIFENLPRSEIDGVEC